MKKLKSGKRLLFVALLALSIGLFGCSGDNGSNGAPGATGATGATGPVTTTGESCNVCHGAGADWNVTNFTADGQHDFNPYTPNYTVTIDNVQFNGTSGTTADAGLTATFTVTDGNGDPVNILDPTVVAPALPSVSLNLSKLVHEVGSPDTTAAVYNWQNYYNITATGNTVDGVAPVSATAIQASKATCVPGTPGPGQGTLAAVTDGSDGRFTCSVPTDFTTVTDPETVTFDGSLPHRVAIYFGSHLTAGEPGNGYADFVPNILLTGTSTLAAAEAAVTNERLVATTASCDECHGKLSGHGGDRVNVEICVTCHNPGTTDPTTGNVLDMSRMIHTIHAGNQLGDINPNVTGAGLVYSVYGHSGIKSFNTVGYPGSLLNCQKCHTTDSNAEGAVTANGDAWKMVPNRSACGSCHIISFDANDTTKPMHGGGPRADDSLCAACHPDAGAIIPTSAIYPVATVHAIAQPSDTAVLSTSTVPTAGFFSKDDSVTFTMAVKDISGNVINVTDPAAFKASRARLYLYGPRDDVHLVLMGGAEQIDLTGTTAGVTQDANGYHYQVTIPDGMMPGTYLAYAYVTYYTDPADTTSATESVYQLIPFQVGTATPQLPVAGTTGCGSCHDNNAGIHNSALIETTGSDVCLACHNGEHTFPISNRVHAVHDANTYGDLYQLDSTTASGYKEPLNTARDWSGVVAGDDAIEYPQAVTHCQTCHNSGSTEYQQKASTAPCFGCHGGLNNGVIDHMRQNGSPY